MTQQLAIFDTAVGNITPLQWPYPQTPYPTSGFGNSISIFSPIPEGRAFRVFLAPEGVESSDGRLLAEGSIWTRRPPLPLMFLNKTTGAHQDAVFVGNILKVWRDGNKIMGEGVFDSSVDAREAVRVVSEGRLTRVSIDTAINDYEYTEDDKLIVKRGELMGATIVPFSAFGDTYIEMMEGEESDIEVAPLVASIAKPDNIPTDAFTVAEPAGVTPITVDDEGRIFGHLALWDTCHVGISDRCVMAPKSATDYAHFLIGKMGGERVGVITMNTVHASENMGRDATVRHYADTGTIAAYVTITDGDYGPWVSGFVEPSLTDKQVRQLQASGISGDWRYDKASRNMELVAILAVPTPGFTVPRYSKEKKVIMASIQFAEEPCTDCPGAEAAEQAKVDVEAARKAAETEEVTLEEVMPEEPEIDEVVIVSNNDVEEVVEEVDTILESELAEALDSLLEDAARVAEERQLDRLLNA